MIADTPDLIAKRAELSPDAVAMEEVATGRCLTYAELSARAGQAASLMASRDVGEGDRVAILCRNRIAFFELLFGCAKLGAILVPLNWRMPQSELEQLVQDFEPKLLFAGSEHEAVARDLGLTTVDLDGNYEVLIEEAAFRDWRTRWPAEGIWYLIYTSGTTGRPKGVIYNFRMALANSVNIGSAIGIRSTDATLNFLPLFHTAGINLHTLPALFAGGRVLILEGFDEEAVVRLLEERRLDTFFAVPTVYQALLDHPRFARGPLDAVRHWGCGGAPLADTVVEQFRTLGVRVCNGMGMTETGPTAFLADPTAAWDRMGSVGKPQLLCSARIVDDEGRDVPDGTVGDLLFSGPGITPGYWRNEAATRAAFTEDGWLRSGDLACRDPDGFYYVVGRRKEMFISGGENVYPIEVENVLAAHPAVAEAAVVPAPDAKWGEVARAFILPASEFMPRPDELQAFCRARLAAYKVPRSFEFVSDFPRTAAGKIRKHQLVTTSGSAAGEGLREAG
jgi:fatty-acyl-CoA synthase